MSINRRGITSVSTVLGIDKGSFFRRIGGESRVGEEDSDGERGLRVDVDVLGGDAVCGCEGGIHGGDGVIGSRGDA